MKAPRLISLILLVTILHITLSQDVPVTLSTTEESIINLNLENFEHLVESGRSERWFIMFHVGCPSCQEIYPIWNNFTKSRRGIRLGSVNCTAYPSLAVKYGVKSFPTFVFFDDGKMEIYEGDNTDEAWNNFISKKKGAENINQTIPDAALQEDNVVHLQQDDFDTYVLASEGRPWFIMFHTHCPECETAFPAWHEFAKSRKEGPNIGMVDCKKNPELAKRFDVKSYPTFIYFDDEGEQQIFNGERRIKDWSQYVDQKENKDLAAETPVFNITNKTANTSVTNAESSNVEIPTPETPVAEAPVVGDAVIKLTQDNFESLVNSADSGSWFIMFYAPWCPHCQRAAPTWNELARAKKDGAKIGMVNCVEESELQSKYGVQGFPTFMFFDQGKTEVFNGPRTVEAWSQFIDEKTRHTEAPSAPIEAPSAPSEPIPSAVAVDERKAPEPIEELTPTLFNVGEFERPINESDETRTGTPLKIGSGEEQPLVVAEVPSTESAERLPEPAIGNLNALNATLATQNGSITASQPSRPAEEPTPTLPEPFIGDLTAVEKDSETKEAPITTIAFERPAAGANENRPGITVETLNERPNEGRFEDNKVHYKEPMLVIGVIAGLLLVSFFTFLCYQQFRGKYSPIATMDGDVEAGEGATDSSNVKRDSFSNSLRF